MSAPGRGARLASSAIGVLLLLSLLLTASPVPGQEEDPAPAEPAPAEPAPAAPAPDDPAPPPADVAGGTPRLGGDGPPGIMAGLGEAYLEKTPEATNVATRDDVGKAVEKAEELFRQQSGAVNSATEGAPKGGGSVVGKALDKINLFNTAVKAAAYAWEGDANGAINVVIKEGVKKVTGAGLQFVGSFIPGVGNIVGATANEEVNSRYIAPFLDKHTDEARNKEAREKYLGWDLPGDEVMDARGNVRRLPRGMYLDPGTGLIKQRSPVAQRAYEAQMRRDFQDAARSQHPLSKAQRRLARGEIDQSEFGRICREWNNNPNRNNWRQEQEGGSGAYAPGPRRRPVPPPTQRRPADPDKEDLSKLSDDEWHKRLRDISAKGKGDVAKARQELQEALKKLRKARQSK